MLLMSQQSPSILSFSHMSTFARCVVLQRELSQDLNTSADEGIPAIEFFFEDPRWALVMFALQIAMNPCETISGWWSEPL